MTSVNSAEVSANAAPPLLVTKTADTNDGVCDADCSLREAIAAAAAGDTITFANSLNGQTLLLSTIGDPTAGPSAFGIDKNLTIAADANRITIARDPSVTMRLFYIATGATLTLQNLTVQNFRHNGGDAAYGGGGAGLGGAIFNNGGTLQLVSSTFVGNIAHGGTSFSISGAHGGGGGLDGSFAGNSGGGPNGGISYGSSGGFGGGGGAGSPGGFGGFGGGGGRGISNGSPSYPGGFGGGASAPAGGPASGGGGGMGGAIFSNGGSVIITNSTLTGNSALGGGTVNGGNGSGFGGAIFNRDGSLTIINSTLTANIAANGGRQVYSLGDGDHSGGDPITSNNADTTFTNSILGQSDTAVTDFVSNTINGGTSTTAGTNNLIRSHTGFTGSIVSTNDSLLAPLGFYGGQTMTHALLAGSTAINAGTSTGAPSTDQRGASRVGNVDIGAFELNNSANGGNFKAVLPVGRQGEAYNYIIASNNGSFAYQFSGGALPNGINLSTNPVINGIVSLSGTPTESGIFNFTIGVADPNETSFFEYTLEILPSPPDLAITKSDGGANAAPGGTIAYSLNYSNTGGSATGVVITETVPAHTTFNAAASSAGWICSLNNQAGSICTLNIGSLGGGANGNATFAVTVNNPAAAGINQISNTAVIGDDGANGGDPNPDNNSAADTTPLNASPDLSLTKSDGGVSVTPGGAISYSLNYFNNGNQGAAGVVITETVPANTTFNSAASDGGWTCLPNNQAGSICTLTIGSLDGGASGSATFAVTVNTTGLSGIGQISNTASIADDGANGADPTPANNSASDTTPIMCQQITVTNPANGGATQGASFSEMFTQNGGSGAVTFSTASVLPDGLNLAANGTLSGIPTESGTFPIIVTATDANNCSVSGSTYNLSICATAPVVTNTNDSGAGSLRQAILDACPGGTITFASPLFDSPQTININGQLVIDKNLTINGTGANLTTIRNVAPAGGTSRVFIIMDGANLTAGGLRITGGNPTNPAESRNGGGIYIEHGGAVTLNDSTVVNNTAGTEGGGIYIESGGELNLNNSTLLNNTAGTEGGGIANRGAAALTNSLVFDNTAGTEGGGIVNRNSFYLINSTVSGNNANLDGGIKNNAVFYSINSTIFDNTAANARGGGVTNNSGSFYAANTIIAGNTGPNPDFSGTLISQGYNLIGNTNGTTVTGDTTGNLLNVSAGLAPLDNNGGATQTHALLPNSPALNMGGNALAVDADNNPLETDQRGAGFPRIVGSAVDIGAFEVQDSTPPVITPTLTGTLGNNGWYVSDVQVSWSVTDDESAVSNQTGCDTQSVTADAAGVTFTCEATSAGGMSSQSVTVKRDATAPTITFDSRTAANANGWNNTNVSVNWNCSDALSGAVNSSVSQTVSSEGANQSATGTCFDLAGNSASNTQTGISIDKTAPVIDPLENITVSLPPNSNAVSIAVNFNLPTASDNFGPVTVMTNPASGAQFPVGTTIVQVTATDAAGNQSFSSFTVTVQYRFSLFYYSNLLLSEQVLNQVTAGSNLPVRFSLSGNQGNPYSQPPTSQQISCSTLAPIGPAQEISRYAPDPFYSALYDFYQTTWRTQTAWRFTCRRLTLYFKDGTTRSLDFFFR